MDDAQVNDPGLQAGLALDRHEGAVAAAEVLDQESVVEDEHPELFVLENGGERDGFNTALYDGEAIVGRLDWHMDLHYTGKPNRGALLPASGHTCARDKRGLCNRLCGHCR